jgi:hypothetical protein
MSIDSESNDGSETFWPGYVDAVTNLVLNLLFLITIMTVAVFMFALELGRTSRGIAEVEHKVGTTQRQAPAEREVLRQPVGTVDEEISSEIQPERTMPGPEIAGGSDAAITTEVVSASSVIPEPQKGLEKTVGGDAEVTVRFMDDAVTLTPEELPQLRKALESIAQRGKARIEVVVPKGFSEAKRLGFYRAMTVRNLLLEMKMPKDRIELSVREGRSNANASLVRVSSQ